MNKEFIKEAKNFRMLMKWCSVICWFVTTLLAYNAPYGIGYWGILVVGAIVFTTIYFNMNRHIREQENKSWDKC